MSPNFNSFLSHKHSSKANFAQIQRGGLGVGTPSISQVMGFEMVKLCHTTICPFSIRTYKIHSKRQVLKMKDLFSPVIKRQTIFTKSLILYTGHGSKLFFVLNNLNWRLLPLKLVNSQCFNHFLMKW